LPPVKKFFLGVEEMKKLAMCFAGIIALTMLFAGCDNGTTSDDDDDGGGGTPVTGVMISAAELTLAAGETESLTALVLPDNAAEKSVTWSSNTSAVATVSEAGVVTAVAEGEAVITVTTVGKKADGSAATAVCAVTVSNTRPLHWTFQTNPEGWTEGSTLAVPGTDKDYGNGMTLLGATGSTDVNTDTGSGAQMAVSPTQAAPTLVAAGVSPDDFTAGRIRVNKGAFAKITGVQGPYTIQITYYSANATAVNRYPVIKIGAVTYNMDGGLSHSETGKNSEDADTALGVILRLPYFNTDTPDILLKSNDNIYIHDVIISPGAVNLGDGVEDVTLNKDALQLSIGDTETLTATVLPDAASNKNVTWSSNHPEVAAVSEAGLVSAVSAGSATITVTTAGKNVYGIAETASCIVTVASAGGGGTDVFWNFSDDAFKVLPVTSNGIVSETTISGLTILATSIAQMSYNANNKTIDGVSFSYRLQLNGSGNTTQRSLKFDVTGPCAITVYGTTASSGNTRQLFLSNGTEVIGTKDFPGDVRVDYDYTGSGGTVYLYAGGGINLYGVRVDYP
jgi:uncharacterized protein YjdB